MKNKRHSPGLTFVELLLAISLTGMIVLAVAAVDVVSRRFFSSADYEAQVQNEISPIVELIAKDLSLASGEQAHSGVKVSLGRDRVELKRMDNSIFEHGSRNGHTYGDHSDDPWIAYFFVDSDKAISTERKPSESGSWGERELLARNITGCEFLLSTDSAVSIVATARRNALGPSSSSNPEVRVETSVFARMQSLK